MLPITLSTMAQISKGSLSIFTSSDPAVNQSVAIEYPKLRARYGNSVTYAEDKSAHLKTEFGFDMVQVAKNRYAPQQYHDFIGFQVSEPLLERVFPVIYGLQLKDVIAHEDLAIGSYRFAISRLIPEMTKVALETHKQEVMHEHPDFAKKTFLYHLSRSDYEREWGKDYTRPGIGARILAVFFRLIPKIRPFIFSRMILTRVAAAREEIRAVRPENCERYFGVSVRSFGCN